MDDTDMLFTRIRRGLRNCPTCGGLNDRLPQRACHACHAAYMRRWRKDHPLTGTQRRREIARSYAGVYLRRGKLVRQPCEVCGDPEVQMHHDDYDKPTQVRWLCAFHHHEHHHS